MSGLNHFETQKKGDLNDCSKRLATYVVLRVVPARHWSHFWAMAMALDESHKGWES